MLRLVRPISSALFGGADYSPLSVLPSYAKCFGSNPLPGQVVVAISVILAIRAYATFHNWKRIDPVPFKDDADALREWNASSAKPLLGLQIAQLLLSTLLLFMAADSMETMATFRALFLLLLLLFPVGGIAIERSPGNAHPNLVASTTMNHFSWVLQTLLLPGLWALCDDAIRSTWSGSIFVAFIYSLIFWSVGGFFILPAVSQVNETRAKRKCDACEEDLQRLVSVEQAAVEDNKGLAPGVEQLVARTKRGVSAALLVALVDLVLLIGLQFG